MQLAKVHKYEKPIRPVLSLPGSSYKSIKKRFAKSYRQHQWSHLGTNIKDARETIENIALDPDETVNSLGVKAYKLMST